MTQASMMERYEALINGGESAFDAAIAVGHQLAEEEARIVREGRDDVAYVEVRRLAKWWGKWDSESGLLLQN